MNIEVKICGLTTPESIVAANDADYKGFVFFPPSPRHITLEQAILLKKYSHNSKMVAVTVDADDNFLPQLAEKFVPDYIQLHGNETPERMYALKKRFNIPLIKAFRIKNANDLAKITLFEEVADMFLLDAKVENGLPGGNGLHFDWKIAAHYSFKKPWFLSGGINVDNVLMALSVTHAPKIDVSSSLETAPGVKSPKMIKEFITAVKKV